MTFSTVLSGVGVSSKDLKTTVNNDSNANLIGCNKIVQIIGDI